MPTEQEKPLYCTNCGGDIRQTDNFMEDMYRCRACGKVCKQMVANRPEIANAD